MSRLADALAAVRQYREQLAWFPEDCDEDLAGRDWQPFGTDGLYVTFQGRGLAWVVLEQRRGPLGWFLWPLRRALSGTESGHAFLPSVKDDALQARGTMAICEPTFIAPPVARAAVAGELALDVIAARLASDGALGVRPYAEGPRLANEGVFGEIGWGRWATEQPSCCDGGCTDPVTWYPFKWCGVAAPMSPAERSALDELLEDHEAWLATLPRGTLS